MRLSCISPVIIALLCGLLPLASPGNAEKWPAQSITPSDPEENDRSIHSNTVTKETIEIPGWSSETKKTKILISNATSVRLECKLSSDSGDCDVAWQHGSEKLLNATNTSENKCHTVYEFQLSDPTKIGTYSCIFNRSSEVRAEFHITVPPVKGADKPFVTYNGDSIVMKCDSSKYNPIEWIWYKVNESEKVQLNMSQGSTKYVLEHKRANETKLHVSDLSEEDDGTYICKAVFKVGESEGHVKLSVLSYMVPLKVFFIIAAEVAVLVTVILIYEMQTKKKQSQPEDQNDTEQAENLKSEESDSAETSTARQRKV
ncbi:embigin [Xenopus laevis]|uniref:Ig-like domain-containing protein n=2 Tax=Xenopus laevis TaxID=8355 RepID=A0A974E2D9_XENLA|nr:embigin [Xenopus laevis]OCU02550.1 hypothetical protein XELAEV_18008312mg [Xenopus laevis]